MEIRKDLESVAPYISRLLSIGAEFRAFNKDWSHFKNQEDFRFVSRIPYEKRNKVEAVYGDGRDMAIYMYDALLAINYDFSRYPTLSAIIESFKNSWVYGNYDKDVPNIAKSICLEHNINLWSVNQMVILFQKQEQLLETVRTTLKILQNSDLYKIENGASIMKQEANIQVSGNSNTNVIINSSDTTTSVAINYNEPKIFADLISAIKENGFDSETESNLINNVQTLASSHKNGGFKEAYKDFMQNVSTHIAVFAPFISGLSTLL